MSFFKHIALLSWKNLILQKRKPIVTIFEISLPIFFAVLLVIIRLLVEVEPINTATKWKHFPIDNVRSVLSKNSTLVYCPDQTKINELMIRVAENINNQQGRDFVDLIGFRTEEDLLFYNTNASDVWAGVVFDSSKDYSTSIPNDVTYSLRVTLPDGNNKRWHTDNTYPFFKSVGFRNNMTRGGTDPDYYSTGFLGLQYQVGKEIINSVSETPVNFDNYEILMEKMPYPPFVRDYLLPAIQQQLPLFLILGFILYALQLSKGIVYEKENRLKEAMKMMGMSPAVYWTSWFIKALVYLIISSAVYAILFAIKTEKGSVLAASDPSLVFIFLLCYSVSIIAFCFMFSTFFKKANLGANATGILFYLTYVPYFFLQQRYEDMALPEKMASCLLSNIAMAFGMNTIGLYEGTGEGAQLDNFTSPATVDDNFSLLYAMLMLLADSVLYFFIGWYVDNVFPGEFGVPQPWYFLFTTSYWCGKRVSADKTFVIQTPNTSYFERDPVGLKTGISIKNLRKEFGSGKGRKVAVSGTSLNIYEGQITALLGHNGAGKTTTMSMLTGFIPPTSGTAIVDGYDIRTDILGVRKSLGFCPQHNILFDMLTVREHLQFFALLKGCPRSQVNTEVEDMIGVLGLQSKANALSKTLSGGQKRKLSVGIALIGGTKMIILDEPTSGMDPAARRQTWDILQKFRKGRVIILSTHFMDEADLLGDRIAIMAEGTIQCCGSSLFLKKAYGTGYHLVIVKDKTCDVELLTKTIRSHIPTASLQSEISAELSYLLPFDEASKFEGLFMDIESRKTELGLSSFGTTATTMEEVFLKVGEMATEAEDDNDDEIPNERSKVNGHTNQGYGSIEKHTNGIIANGAVRSEYGNAIVADSDSSTSLETVSANFGFIEFNRGLMKNTGSVWLAQQFWAMILKKIIHTARNRLVTAIQLIIPVVFTIFALSVEKTIPKQQDEPALTLNLGPFSNPLIPFNINASLNLNITQSYAMLVQSKGYQLDNTSLSAEAFDDYLPTKAQEIGTATFDKRYIIGADFYPSDTPNAQMQTITTFFNGEPFHSPAISLAYLMDAMLKYYTDMSHNITTINHPFPRRIDEQRNAITAGTIGTAFTVAFCILFGMAFLTTSFIIFLIKEKASGAKHMQVVSGVNPLAFWSSAFVWDMVNYLVPVLLLLIVFAAFQVDAYTNDGRLGLVLGLFVIYGWAVLPFVYLLHYLFKTAAGGMVAVTMLNIITGLATLMAVFVLKIPQLDTGNASDILDWIFTTIIPNYCLGEGIMNIYTNYEYTRICEPIQLLCPFLPDDAPLECCPERCGSSCLAFTDNYLDWEFPGIGKYFVFMAIQGLLYFLLIFLIESGLLTNVFYSICSTNNEHTGLSVEDEEQLITDRIEDDDVAEERQRINHTPLDRLMGTDSLILQNITKQYGSFLAVDSICVGVPKQECFGLLGQNGAGKTSTFKILTGDQMLTSGNAFVNTFDIRQHMKQVQKNLGYCPQFDALIDQMTGRETLTMYARLRGVKENQIGHIVNELLDVLMLGKYSDRQCGLYSGGNKRKLCTAIALIGDPPFVMLDEPTTGMDPGARRQLWNVLSQIRASGRTLILTSHSMEECDALCTKIAIMVNGHFMCLGSPQHLKNKFGHGYTLVVRLGTEDAQNTSDSLKEFVKSSFPDSNIFDDHQGYLHFQIPDANVPLARVFGTMERAKTSYNIEDYSVHQTTLEQVFLTFTRNQIAPTETPKGFSCSKLCC